MTKKLTILFLILVLVLLGFNFYLKKTDPLYSFRQQLISLSTGQRYQGYLSLYRYYLENNNLSAAKSIESKLDSNDIKALKSDYYPEFIAKSINEILYKSQKSVDDWLEVAKLQAKIGLIKEAKESLKNAHLMDPVRDDVDQLYLQFK